jgi:hypothetical protein
MKKLITPFIAQTFPLDWAISVLGEFWAASGIAMAGTSGKLSPSVAPGKNDPAAQARGVCVQIPSPLHKKLKVSSS